MDDDKFKYELRNIKRLNEGKLFPLHSDGDFVNLGKGRIRTLGSRVRPREEEKEEEKKLLLFIKAVINKP